MAHSDARAWWADVQYLRDDYERTDAARRRADEADLASRTASRDRDGVEAELSPAHRAARGAHANPIAAAPPAPDGSFASRRGHDLEPALAPRRGHGTEQAPAPRRGHDMEQAFAPRRGHDMEQAFAPRRGHDMEQAFAPRRGHDTEPAFAPRRGHDTAPAFEPRAPLVPGDGALGRRTIEIRGRTVPAPAVPRATEVDRRRQQRRAIERVGARPDRVAMWALLMGLLLILVAIGTADAPAVVAFTLR
jgi:hypothetical protein